MYSTMADPDLELRREGGGGQFCFACLASFSSYSDFFFLTKIRGGQVASLDLPLQYTVKSHYSKSQLL